MTSFLDFFGFCPIQFLGPGIPSRPFWALFSFRYRDSFVGFLFLLILFGLVGEFWESNVGFVHPELLVSDGSDCNSESSFSSYKNPTWCRKVIWFRCLVCWFKFFFSRFFHLHSSILLLFYLLIDWRMISLWLVGLSSFSSQYLTELLTERQKLVPFNQVLPICHRLLNQGLLFVFSFF